MQQKSLKNLSKLILVKAKLLFSLSTIKTGQLCLHITVF